MYNSNKKLQTIKLINNESIKIVNGHNLISFNIKWKKNYELLKQKLFFRKNVYRQVYNQIKIKLVDPTYLLIRMKFINLQHLSLIIKNQYV